MSATETTIRPPSCDASSEQEETKYHLIRPSGTSGILPSPGSRRFSKMYVSRALGLENKIDTKTSEKQSPWDDIDVYSEACWRRWCGLL